MGENHRTCQHFPSEAPTCMCVFTKMHKDKVFKNPKWSRCMENQWHSTLLLFKLKLMPQQETDPLILQLWAKDVFFTFVLLELLGSISAFSHGSGSGSWSNGRKPHPNYYNRKGWHILPKTVFVCKGLLCDVCRLFWKLAWCKCAEAVSSVGGCEQWTVFQSTYCQYLRTMCRTLCKWKLHTL